MNKDTKNEYMGIVALVVLILLALVLLYYFFSHQAVKVERMDKNVPIEVTPVNDHK